MASDLARAITALVALDREVEARQRDRRLLRKATEQVALLLIERTRVGDEATVNGVVYRTEQVTWPIETEGGASQPHPHGARALLRDNKVLVVAERDNRGRASAISVGSSLAGRPPDSPEAVTYDLHIASDEDRLAFATEIGDTLDAFRVLITADADTLRDASAELVATLVKLFA
jgi:hypothetical protein